ncbi:Uncharacterized conserved protein YgbK, DUF1537 family [Chitinophaga rupis]|uniref:Uncharacterized conserved protein YgbK, DUF1537 family n=1 Tax=Chitinophaga rupis TaxID=573321 RepID=A0A1H8CCY9_9BACT|nr:four-carbon acid sugar kinase family protein [Chitinophaga rupis]SEM92822.1 Uncharacterized conserved protein YgbK, DUF1537 family [Chitinophaga rupis]
MMVVIADDLTGAAEIGGLALKYGLMAEITTTVNLHTNADLLIIDTDTRSLSKTAAKAVITEICAGLKALQPTLLFKKIDSVLRGHVLAEIQLQQELLQLPKALIVPANPGLGRTVVNSTYLLNGRPLHQSSFSQDPEFPVYSSGITELLQAKDGDIQVLPHHAPQPETGIVVAEVESSTDLVAWSKKLDAGTLVAGAAEFFATILEARNMRPVIMEKSSATLQPPALMICGSAFHKSRAFVKKIEQDGFPVSYMPAVLDTTGDAQLFQHWMEDTLQQLKQEGKVSIAVHPQMEDDRAHALNIRNKMAEAAAFIAGQATLHEILIEGGSTAAAVMRKLGIDRLYPTMALAPGVTRMRVQGNEELHLTLKPGSYEWPPLDLFPLMQ